VLGLKPVTDKYSTTLDVPAGAAGMPEFCAAVPSVNVTRGVMVKAPVALLPKLSTTKTQCAPPVESTAPEGTVNWNTHVPCSVTVGLAGVLVAVV